MAGQDRRGEHRAALFEQKGEVGGHRRSEREGQSEDHDKAPRRVVACRKRRIHIVAVRDWLCARDSEE
jgi:hypothetical protein